MSKLLRFLSFLLPLVLSVPFARAQATSTLTGIAVDQSGAKITGATVQVTEQQTGVVHSVTTNSSGEYTVPLLQPGTYRVRAMAAGFTSRQIDALVLQVSQTERLDLAFTIGESSTTMDVEATQIATDTESSSLGTVIENRTVVDMPLNGRQFYTLALLVPGTYPPVQNSTLGFRGGFNVAGSSEVANFFTLDGFNNVDGANGAPTVRPSIDDVQEFKLQTGVYQAEFGHNNGGQVTVITKSGTNKLHGTVYDFLRNDAFDAVNFFTQPGTPNALKRNDFGGTLGGPLQRDKTFFFFSYEGLRLIQSVTALGNVPTAAQQSGNFSGFATLKAPTNYDALAVANNVINPAFLTASQLQSYTVGKALLSYYPSPNINGANNYSFDGRRTEHANQYSLRLDHTFSASDSVSATLQYFNDPSFEPSNSLCGSAKIPGFGCSAPYTGQLYGGIWNHIFSASLYNQLRVGFQRARGSRYGQDDTNNFNQKYGINAFTDSTPDNAGVPYTVITGYSTLGSLVNLPQDRRDNTFEFADDIFLTKGKHSVKFGADFTRFQNNDLFVFYGRGLLSFTSANGSGGTGNALADALLGLPTATIRTPTAPMSYVRTNYIAAFAQDDYKVTPRLTMNYGLRWELFGPPMDTRNNLANFDPGAGKPYQVGTGGYSNLPWTNKFHDFGPRLGLSYQPFHSEKTVLRAGFGLMFDAQPTENGIFNLITSTPVRQSLTFASIPQIQLTLANPFPTAGFTTALTPGGATPDFQPAQVYEYTADVQHQLPAGLLLDLAYFGSVGRHLPDEINLNQPLSGYATTALATAGRPYPAYGNITYDQSEGASNYNSLQAKVQRGFNHGFTFLMSYTYARSLDNTPGIATTDGASSNFPQNSRNIGADYGRSGFDIKQRFVLSSVYDLPFGAGKEFVNHGLAARVLGGYQLSGIMTVQSGTPVTPTYSINISNTFNNTLGSIDRPNVTGDPNHGPRTVNQWFTTSVYSRPATGAFGNAGRNSINAPGYTDLDIAFARTFGVFERLNLQAKAEAFNLFNHPNFGLPNTVVDSTATFGTITTAQAQRQIQLSLRLVF